MYRGTPTLSTTHVLPKVLQVFNAVAKWKTKKQWHLLYECFGVKSQIIYQTVTSAQGRRLRACGHATHARTFDYTQHMEVRYKLESVEKQHKQARVYINGPQTLIKRSPEVMGCSPKC